MNAQGVYPLPRSMRAVEALRRTCGAEHVRAKLEAIAWMEKCPAETGHALAKRHEILLLFRALGETPEVRAAAGEALERLAESITAGAPQRLEKLDNSGIAGTSVRYSFSFDTALALAGLLPGRVDIDWLAYDDSARLDPLLRQLLAPAERDGFDESERTTREWITTAKGEAGLTDFEFLAAQLRARMRDRDFLEPLYDEADVPLIIKALPLRASSTGMRVLSAGEAARRERFRTLETSAARHIAKPMRGIERLSPAKARKAIDAALLALAMRCREVHAMTYANPNEVYLAPLGMGAHALIIGALPAFRMTLEANYGYIILASDVPIGYGGATPLFSQANTGINVFPEFRGGESAFLFTQTLRAFRHLFGTRRFIVNPYQFGGGNSEARASGAFWFYERLGFQPADAEVRKLAKKEFERHRRNRTYKPPRDRMKKLLSCDLHLDLPGKENPSYFPENLLESAGFLAAQALSEFGHLPRKTALARLRLRVFSQLGVRRRVRWPQDHREGADRLVPVLASLGDLSVLPASDRRDLAALLALKGRPQERDFAIALSRCDILHAELLRRCREANRSGD